MPSSSPRTKLSQHISAIPKLDKKLFISSYLREQKSYAKAYALDGRAIESSWKSSDTPFLDGQPKPVAPTEEYGFGTPVLKPRIAKPIPLESSPPPIVKTQKDGVKATEESHEDRPELANRTKASNHKRPHSESPAQASKARPEKYQPKSSKQRQASIVDSSDEHAMRLKERRDRKRAKRAIVEPSADTDGDAEIKSDKKIKEKGKKKREAKKKIPAGLALMHGFSATNVGSGRITMKLPLNVGVFGKGKASAKAQITNRKSAKKTGRQSQGFSEMAFLNKTSHESSSKRKRKVNISASSAITLSDSNTAPTDPGRSRKSKPRKHIKNAKKKLEVQVPKCTDTVINTTSSNKSMESAKEESDGDSTPNNPGTSLKPIGTTPESIIWDIERDNVSLPSHPIPSDAVKTVLLDTRHLAWASVTPEEIVGLDFAGPKNELDFGKTSKCSSPSIGPSQSASQYGRPIALQDLPLQSSAHSKYFATKTIAREIPKEVPEAPVQKPVQGISAPHSLPEAIHFPLPVAVPHSVISTTKLVLSPDPEHTWCLPPIQSNMDTLEYLPDVELGDYEYSDGVLNLWTFEDNLGPEGLDFPGYVDDETDGAFAQGDLYESDHISCYDIREITSGAFDYDQRLHDMESGEFSEIEQQLEIGPGPEAYASEVSSWNGGDEYEPYDYVDKYDNSGDVSEEQAVQGGIYLSGAEETSESRDLGEEAKDIYTDNDSQGGSWISSCADGSESDSGSVSPVAMFSEGRALLQGLAAEGYRPGGSTRVLRRRQVSLVEADVVKSLRNHWLPQRL